MSTFAVRTSAPWFRQADSDARTAEGLLSKPAPMREADVGCHVAALCSQVIEKSLKGYVLLNGGIPAMNHRPDKLLSTLLTKGSPLLQYEEHHSRLTVLFDPHTRGIVRRLVDLTPGALGRNDVPNTEYPLLLNGEWLRSPSEEPAFADRPSLREWVAAAKRIKDTLYKLWFTVERASSL